MVTVRKTKTKTKKIERHNIMARTIGATSHLPVRVSELNKFFGADSIIFVSRKQVGDTIGLKTVKNAKVGVAFVAKAAKAPAKKVAKPKKAKAVKVAVAPAA